MGPDDAVEALAGSLGKKEAGPEVGKPVEDKVKVMGAQILHRKELSLIALTPQITQSFFTISYNT